MSRSRSADQELRVRRTLWPLIAGALIAILGIGAGVAIAHHQADRDHERAVHEAQDEQNVARQNQARAVREQQLARDAASEARAETSSSDQQLAWMQQCFTLYPVSASLNAPGWSHESALRAMCVVDAGKGTNPAAFLEKHGA